MLTGVEVRFHSQLSQEMFDPESLVGAVGINFFDHGQEKQELLNLEVGIWAISHPRDLAQMRLVAALSFDDGKILRDELMKSLEIPFSELSNLPKSAVLVNHPLINHWQEGEFQGAKVIHHPISRSTEDGVEISSWLPGLERETVLSLPNPEPRNLLTKLCQVLNNSTPRGAGAIKVELETHPDRLIHF